MKTNQNVITFHNLFMEYIEMFKGIQSDSEIANKLNRYKNHIQPIFRGMNIEDIKFKHCQDVCNSIIKVKELSPKTAKNVNAVIQAVYNYAIKNDYTEKNPASHTIIPKFDNKYNIELNTQQIKDLVQEILDFDNPTYRLIFIFALHGRRKSEILKMQYFQIDMETLTYSIPAQKNKSRKHDVHEMTPLLYAELLQYLKFKQNIKQQDYLFVNENTNNYFKDIKRPFNKLKQLAGISKMRFHDFRHLLGTESIKKGVPIEHISQALGHSSIEVTQRYITKDSSISNKVVTSLLDTFSPNVNQDINQKAS